MFGGGERGFSELGLWGILGGRLLFVACQVPSWIVKTAVAQQLVLLGMALSWGGQHAAQQTGVATQVNVRRDEWYDMLRYTLDGSLLI